MSEATYLYCLVRSRTRPSVARAPRGMPGAGRPRLLPVAPSLWLVAASVPKARYAADRIDAGLQDLDWLASCAVAHEAVVEHFMTRDALVPMKLFTIFDSDDRAVRDVRRRRASLGRLVRRVSGCQEWGVRLACDGRAPAPAVRAARPGSGTAFLAGKRRARQQAGEASAAARAAAGRAHRRLARRARAATVRAPAAGAAAPLLLDAAYLVPRRQAVRFRAEARMVARDLGGQGCSVTLTGPWPPYHFVGGS